MMRQLTPEGSLTVSHPPVHVGFTARATIGFTGLPLDGRHANRFETGVWLGGQQRGLLDCELPLPPASSSRDVHRDDVGLENAAAERAKSNRLRTQTNLSVTSPFFSITSRQVV